MSKKGLLLVFSVLGVLILSNIYSGYVNVFTEGIGKSYLYQTEFAEFQFTEVPSKGRDIQMMEAQFSRFKENNPHHAHLELYRTFKMNPLKFWIWFSYCTDDRYDFKFKKKFTSSW